MSTDTGIGISNETWAELNTRKDPGDSFDDVIQRLLADDVDVDELVNRVEESDMAMVALNIRRKAAAGIQDARDCGADTAGDKLVEIKNHADDVLGFDDD